MLVLLVLIEPQVASLEIYFKKFLSRDDDSDSANFLQQIPPPAAVLGVPELTHPCTRCARRATAWGRTPGTFGVSIEGPEWESFTDSSGTQEAAAGAEEHQLPSDSSV